MLIFLLFIPLCLLSSNHSLGFVLTGDLTVLAFQLIQSSRVINFIFIVVMPLAYRLLPPSFELVHLFIKYHSLSFHFGFSYQLQKSVACKSIGYVHFQVLFKIQFFIFLRFEAFYSIFQFLYRIGLFLSRHSNLQVS
jgi:hypothetical protein